MMRDDAPAFAVFHIHDCHQLAWHPVAAPVRGAGKDGMKRYGNGREISLGTGTLYEGHNGIHI